MLFTDVGAMYREARAYILAGLQASLHLSHPVL